MEITAQISQKSCSWGSVGAFGISLMAGCTAADLGSDALEVANIKRSNIVPKSSPAALIHAFDKYCVKGPQDRNQADAQLRNASYVPRPERAPNGARVYVIDNKRPAVALTDKMCLVNARSRTGQTHKFRAYVAKNFPNAKPVPPNTFWHNIEQAWTLPGTPPTIIAAQRDLEPGNYSRYALIYFQPSTTKKAGL